MIRDAIAAQPDASYLLVQQVIMQQAALGQAQARIEALEQQARARQARPSAASAEPSFLSGGWSSTPAQTPLPRDPAGPPPATAPLAVKGSSGLGNFLRGAATTAAGVAGGALLFQGIENLLGGQHSGGFLGGQPPIAGAPEIVENNTLINEYQGADPTAGPDQALLGANSGWADAPDGGPDPFGDADPFAGQGFGDDLSDWT